MNKRQVVIVVVVCVFTACLPCRLYGDVYLPNIFGDHMVVRQQKPVIIRGWADAGEKVDVQLGSRSASVKADFPKIRLFNINSRPNPYPVSNANDNWRVCSPDKVSDFTAVGYFFGKHLHMELNVPVGLVQAAWGGTRIEPWTPRVDFEGLEALAVIVKRIDGAEASIR